MSKEEKLEIIESMLKFEKTALNDEDLSDLLFILSRPIKRHLDKEKEVKSDE